MIRFQCQHCAVTLTVREDRAGTIGRCPRCKQAITIPPSPESEPSVPGDEEGLTLVVPAQPKDKALLDLPDEQESAENEQERQRREQQLLTRIGITPGPQHTGERRFPWPLDILLYPTSVSGLVVLGLLVGIPALVGLLERFVPAVGCVGIGFLVLHGVVALYAGWYFAECVYDSARGGTRAPEFAPPSMGEMWSRVSYLLVVSIVYLLPVVLFRIVVVGFESHRGGMDIIFWVLAAYALVFFPIGLLAMVVNDSISALNPFFLLGSIARTLLQYTALCLLFAALAMSFWLTAQTQSDDERTRSLWLEIGGLAIANYAAFVCAHILGRFYWRNREPLDWGL
ncbi:MAG: DUF4013 domain-containing protein [Sedimentisphaerales bacterium]|nr:DUF4013 domain-containing protein [Sedimentisphaerales bacterium]